MVKTFGQGLGTRRRRSSTWLPLDTDVDDIGKSLLVASDTLWVDGTFLNAGTKVPTGIGAWDFTK